MLVCVFAMCICTRDRGGSAHPAFPAPSDWRGREVQSKTRAKCAARSRRHVMRPVIARSEATKQSMLVFARRDGWLRGVYHRARIRATRWLAMTWRGRDPSVEQTRHRLFRTRAPDPFADQCAAQDRADVRPLDHP